ncbi:hypothetical protein [Lactiplantibacillus plantarum]|uniref:hypothetical protein n=1 Tax=Lactiplantibacillus plantarum TaxID=1590 RepID=UPI001A90E8F5|nr:hypothetical protein [Lactiplantibacillus plantarum]QSW67366.1 hypothetical protein J0X23_02595 [Lactiplantibacillus plantarum]
MQYEQVAITEPKVLESTLGVRNNHDGTYTVTATKKFTRKNDQVVSMSFTKNGLAALTGYLRILTDNGDGGDD